MYDPVRGTSLRRRLAPVAERAILDPAVAREIFESAIRRLGKVVHPIPGTPVVGWRVDSAGFPWLKVAISALDADRLILAIDLTNYDYDPPTCHFETPSGNVVPWSRIRTLSLLYSGVVRGQPQNNISDILVFPNGEGFVCRQGQAGYHETHPEVSWREVRIQNTGRLDFIIDSTIRALDPAKVAALSWGPR